MELSIFDVLGPVMIGPSSSHTAGAARLARVAAMIAKKPFYRVEFTLSGSFAKTGAGHGTHKALLAGALGFKEDDARMKKIERIAEDRGIEWVFFAEDFDDMHENTARIVFYHNDETTSTVWGSSTGGGRIMINRIGAFDTQITADAPTLVVLHLDRPGVVSEVSNVLSESGINIATMQLSREAKGKAASIVIEVDGLIPVGIEDAIKQLPHITEVITIGL